MRYLGRVRDRGGIDDSTYSIDLEAAVRDTNRPATVEGAFDSNSSDS